MDSWTHPRPMINREYGELHPVMAAERDQVASNALRSTTTDAVSHSSKRRRVDENVTRKDRQRRVAFASDDEREQPEEEEEDEYGEDAFAALISAPSAVSLNSKALRKQRQADEREADITAKVCALACYFNNSYGEKRCICSSVRLLLIDSLDCRLSSPTQTMVKRKLSN